MANVSKISIALTPALNELVQNAVAKGGYASASEVVREALREWEAKQALKKEQLKQLRKMIQDGIDSGPAKPFELDEIIQRGRARLAGEKKSA